MKVSDVVKAVKNVMRNLPAIRQEIVSATVAGLSIVGVFEVTFPQISTPHLAFFSTATAVLTGVASFLSNNKVIDGINQFSNQPVWRAKLTYMLKAEHEHR